MNKSNFKQIFLTLALLITAATGAWAADSEKFTTNQGLKIYTGSHVKITATDLYDSGEIKLKNQGQQATIETLNGETIESIVVTATVNPGNCENVQATPGTVQGGQPTSTITDINASSVVISCQYWVGIGEITVYYTTPEPPIEVTIDNTKEQPTASFQIPASDVTVEYSLVRDMIDDANPVEFGGLPADGDITVKKGEDGKYQPVSDLTITLIDPLAAADAQNIIDSEDITIQVIIQKENDQSAIVDSDEEPMTLAAFLADMKPGYYRLKAIASETGAYDGTVYSAAFTTVEKYDLLIQPADEYSKGKLSEVTVAGTAQTLDADGKATVTNVAPGAEVKLKAKRGYVIEKVEAKNAAAAVPVACLISNPAVGQIIGSDGKNYAANAALPTGVDKVAVIVYQNGSNGLALALQDAGQMFWADAITAATNATPKFSNATWRVPTTQDWWNIFGQSGDVDVDVESFVNNNLPGYIIGAGGSILQSYPSYWSSTEIEGIDYARALRANSSENAVNATFHGSQKEEEEGDGLLVRLCLAFSAE